MCIEIIEFTLHQCKNMCDATKINSSSRIKTIRINFNIFNSDVQLSGFSKKTHFLHLLYRVFPLTDYNMSKKALTL